MVETVDIPVKREVRQKIWIIERGYEPDWFSRVGPIYIYTGFVEESGFLSFLM